MAPVATWLGQSGFLFECGDLRILVDPFFSDHEGRAYPPPSLDDVGARCDWLLATHEHVDHLDVASLPAIAARSPGLAVIAPEPLAAMVSEAVPDVPFTGARPGDRIELPGAGSVEVVPAVHGVQPADGYSADPRFVGYLLELDGVRVYHAGDTIATAALLEGLAGMDVDVALLPINGRNFFRERDGLVGNLDFREAVALARHVGATTLVPIHWDLFAANGERPGAAVDEAAESGAALHVVTLCRGLPWIPAVAR
jgi:L-ascorbate metabolism protein UlaG (beta-lactamase superfamily)